MNREDIIRMAREAGFDRAYVSEDAAISLLVPIERFFQAAYAAGAAAEREACARLAERSESAEHCAAAIRARVKA